MMSENIAKSSEGINDSRNPMDYQGLMDPATAKANLEHRERLAGKQIEALAKLRAEFPPNQISVRGQPLKKDSPKGRCPECGGFHGMPAIHLSYVGHAALTNRLLDVDPLWNWEPLSFESNGLPLVDSNGGMWIRLTVCGMTRLGYGDAEGKQGPAAMKERIGDALRNAAMRFGAALDLWHKGELNREYLTEEQMKDIEDALKAAKTLEDLAKTAAGAGEFADADQRERLNALYKSCKKALIAAHKQALKDGNGTE